MKALALMLTRNEEHLLPYTLPPLETICDHIIIADQQSDDKTRAIIKQSKKTTLIDNPPSPPDGNYDTQGRQLLLDAARSFDGNNLLLCIDADEIAPPAVFHDIKDHVQSRHAPGTILRTRWVRLWKDATTYCLPWRGGSHATSHSWLFYDDRRTDYKDKQWWVHNGRVPHHHKATFSLPLRYGLLHFHWVFWRRALWQQVWYQMKEFINVNFDADKLAIINQFYYDPALHGQRVFTRRLPKQWRTGYHPPPPFPKGSLHWREEEVMEFIKQHGIEVFEPLNIWYLDELKQIFEQTLHRSPQASMPASTYVPARQVAAMLKTPEQMMRSTYAYKKLNQWYKKLRGKRP